MPKLLRCSKSDTSGKFVVLNAYIRKKERLKINDLNTKVNKLEIARE